jgi:putative endonuclease
MLFSNMATSVTSTMTIKSVMPWFVYIIRTQDGQLYTGITTDVQRRWHEHLSGKKGARYFRTQTPQSLCYVEGHLDRSSASKREASIKKLPKIAKEVLVKQQNLADLIIFNTATSVP